MKVKIAPLPVFSCRDCPFCEEEYNSYHYQCSHKKAKKPFSIEGKIIPPECPLEEVEYEETF